MSARKTIFACGGVFAKQFLHIAECLQNNFCQWLSVCKTIFADG
jgi:hypothetical protein